MFGEDDDDGNVNQENGHYSSGGERDDDDSESDDMDRNISLSGQDSRYYDTNLPTAHKYLGRLENILGYTLYDDGQVIELLAMYTNTLVFPGYTLPLVIRADYETDNLYQDFKNGYVFVLTCLRDGNDLFEYGVVMEVYENCVKRGSVSLKARGRQRCRLLSGMSEDRNRMNRIRVQILAEPKNGSPISDTQLLNLRSRHGIKEELDARYKKFHLAQYVFPPFVYHLHELRLYVRDIRKGLLPYYEKDSIPQDPTALSYWFVQNFQLTHNERLQILGCNSTLERLQKELKFLNRERLMCCGHCGITIAIQSNIFAMSKDGVQSNYCNPGGVVYETVTVTRANNYTLEGLPSTQFSWFPGYGWTIMKCVQCKSHLGWRFTADKLEPSMFYGLALSCLLIKILGLEAEDARDQFNPPPRSLSSSAIHLP